MEFPPKKNKWMGFLKFWLLISRGCNFGDQMRRMESAIATVQRIDDKPKKMPAMPSAGESVKG